MFPGTLWAAFKASRLSGASLLFPLFVFGLVLWVIGHQAKRLMRRMRWMIPALGVAVALACFVVAGASYAKRNNVKLLGMPFVHVGTGPNLIAPSAAAPTALETLMATAVGRWKAEDAACNGTQGDCSDGEDVETLHDSSSGGNDFTQNTASAKPTWDADCGIAGASFPCLYFDGGDKLLAGDVLDSVFAGSDSSFTLVAVYYSVLAGSDGILMGKFGGASAEFIATANSDGSPIFCGGGGLGIRTYFASSGTRYGEACGSYLSQGVDIHAGFIEYDGSIDSSAADRFTDFSEDRYDDTPTTATSGAIGDISDTSIELCIGSYNCTGSTQYFKGRIAEIIVFSGALSTAEKTTLNTYLKDTYNIVRPPPGYVADWRADQAACSGTQGDCANGETAETLHDIGSGGNDFANATGTDVPTYVAAGPNSQPAIDFDGTDDNYNAGDVDLFSGTDSDWAVVGVYINEADQEGVLLGKYSSSQTEILIDVDNASCADGTIVYLHYSLANGTSYRWTCGDTSIRDGSYHSFVWNYDGSQDASDGLARFDVYEDGVALTEAVDGTAGTLGDIQNTTGDLTIGYLSGGSTFLNGKMAELLVYPAPLTAAQITGLSEYLTARYGL